MSYDSSARLLRFKEGTDDEGVAAARMTLRSEPAGDEARAAMIAARSSMPASSAKKMTEYVPDLPAEQVNVIRPFVEDAITLALPQNSYSVEALLGPCMHFVYWAVFVVGADLDASIIFDRELIEHYVRESLPELAEGTRRNHRAWLFRVAEAVNPEANPRNPMPLNERSLDTPYDDDERTALDHWAAGQATPYMRQAATVLIALGTGAGLSSGEIATLRRESVTEGPDRVVSIELPGEDKPRIVPVTARYEKALAKAIKKVPAGAFVFLPNRTRTGNEVVSAWVARSLTPPGTPTVRVRRMRNTWLVTHMANRVDVLTLMEAAGLQSLESISRLAAFVPRPSEDARTAQLRGTK
ncbi:site-specific integrase [Cryobacterium tepidiphilum]|uniref:Site-specific integrase n=1 Tax=Cryobacterium tepidiphilum TaxID=2486026 RepID=A0A3M8L374_9MICO|nr:site-specific integrase [Cryobacterium tepidiphilum]RNE59359.1 site-specific integrase [Cryobacterium tepidiphilum]